MDRRDDVLALVINLRRHAARRARAEALVASMPVPARVMDAVDGQDLDPALLDQTRRKRFWPPYPYPMVINEVACFMSHQKAWREIIDGGARFGLVLEDDVELAPEFAATVAAVLASPEPWDYVQLHKFRGKPGRPGPLIARRIMPQLGMQGYLVTAKAAAQLLRTSSIIERPVDSFVQLPLVTGVSVHHLSMPVATERHEALGGPTIPRIGPTTFADRLRLKLAKRRYYLGLRLHGLKARLSRAP